MTQSKTAYTNLSLRSPRAAHTIGMSTLARECQAVKAPVRWNAVRDVVCRHLQIAVSTSRDIKRIIKSGQCAAIVEKVAKCAQEHQSPRNYRVIGGIFLIIREISLDSILVAEIYRQNLDDLVFRSLDPDTGVQELLAPAIHVLAQLSKTSPSREISHRLAVKGTGMTVRLLSKHNENAETHFMLIVLLHTYVTKLSRHRNFHENAHTAKETKSLELFRAARTLVDLLENRIRGRFLDWEGLRLMTDTFTWLSFYQREAILQLPCFTGIRMFVAFISGPCLTIRCRGLLGLLNIHSMNCEGEIRLCNPHLCMRLRGLPTVEAHIEVACDPSKKDHEGPPQHESKSDKGYEESPAELELPESLPSNFDPYEAGLRMVEFELNGPETELESFAYPSERLFGTATPTSTMFTAMECALRSQQKEYEADVVKLGGLVLSLRQTKITGAGYDRIVRLHFSERVAAINGVRQWPDSAYFYYGFIRYRSGSRHLESGMRGLQCPDCTPYLATQIRYQMVLNKFTMAVTHLAIYDDQSEWWKTGVQYLMQMPASISEASKQKTDLAKLDLSIAEAVEVLSTNKSLDHGEFVAAMNDINRHRKNIARTSTPFIDAMKTMHEITLEREQIAQALKREEVPQDAELEKSMAKEVEYHTYDDGQPVLPQCSWCHQTTMGLRKCSRCEKVKYCGTKCQNNHWSSGHKLECISPEISV
ncbi:hypothetical protein SISSUDRAFT_813455 [Sistotremastrum suecicum HHB10207 ss-3]|uniref:MYND-type domain-containing protein n=1 Tax=Sistotremastrum suecicum HHB10207 ss-3 TaxID=1314776 RepID=A0A166CWK2_9AGAM|nr:hypothetical protein SISSUDRAFT_813455 [Sistotremastrum suecicum HHB10207 ss-3]